MTLKKEAAVYIVTLSILHPNYKKDLKFLNSDKFQKSRLKKKNTPIYNIIKVI